MIEWSLFQLFLGMQNILEFFTQKFINDMMGTSNLKIDGEMGKGLYS